MNAAASDIRSRKQSGIVEQGNEGTAEVRVPDRRVANLEAAGRTRR